MKTDMRFLQDGDLVARKENGAQVKRDVVILTASALEEWADGRPHDAVGDLADPQFIVLSQSVMRCAQTAQTGSIEKGAGIREPGWVRDTLRARLDTATCAVKVLLVSNEDMQEAHLIARTAWDEKWPKPPLEDFLIVGAARRLSGTSGFERRRVRILTGAADAVMLELVTTLTEHRLGASRIVGVTARRFTKGLVYGDVVNERVDALLKLRETLGSKPVGVGVGGQGGPAAHPSQNAGSAQRSARGNVWDTNSLPHVLDTRRHGDQVVPTSVWAEVLALSFSPGRFRLLAENLRKRRLGWRIGENWRSRKVTTDAARSHDVREVALTTFLDLHSHDVPPKGCCGVSDEELVLTAAALGYTLVTKDHIKKTTPSKWAKANLPDGAVTVCRPGELPA